MKIGFFGGSFNPPHLGHLLAATYALKIHQLDEVWIAPVFHHPFAKQMIDFEHRYNMCSLLVKKLTPPVRVTDIERNMNQGGKTIFTLRELQSKNSQHTFSLIIGSDLKEQIKTWSHPEELQKEFKIHIIPRGLQNNPTSIPNISSSDIRTKTFSNEDIKTMVTPEIHEYMTEHKLYSF